MLDLKKIEETPLDVKNNLGRRKFDSSIIDKVLDINKKRKSLIQSTEEIKSQLNALSKKVGELKKSGKDANDEIAQVGELKKQNEKNDAELFEAQKQLDQILLTIPNLLEESTPNGLSEEDNQEVTRWGSIPKFDFEVKDHVALGENLGLLDLETAAKLSGARFSLTFGHLAKLERALSNFMLDFLSSRGYLETIPPFIVHERSLIGTGQLPKFHEDQFKIADSDWYLIPTSEVPLTNIKREKIINEEEFPFYYTASTPCFRREAGSYGKDTRGLIRVHQFTKVEMVNIVLPEKSQEAHEAMAKNAGDILEQLNLPYRKMVLCSADVGFGAQKTYDFEVWLPAQNKYREISSVSNCGDFQARRAGIRVRRKSNQKIEFAHTLNGSGLAVGRTLVAILENFQRKDGSVSIPQALWPYLGGIKEIPMAQK